MRHVTRFMLVLLALSWLTNTFALAQATLTQEDVRMPTTLVRIVNQLDAILPLIDQAEREQRTAPLNHIQFRFNAFTTQDGVMHNGLRQDILQLRQAIIDAIDNTPLLPNQLPTLALDYVDVVRHDVAKKTVFTEQGGEEKTIYVAR